MPSPLDNSVRWSQGDVSLNVKALPFINTFDDAVDVAVHGVVVVTQTCDIINDKDGLEIPALVQVAGLVEATPQIISEVKRYWLPRYMYVPAVADRNLIADLNLCATFDRAALKGWERLPAEDDAVARSAIEFALGRHRSRHAFPDRWSAAFSKVRDWIRSKGGKDSDEGRFVDAIQELRIVADEVEMPPYVIVVVIISSDTLQGIRNKWVAEMLPKLRGKLEEGWASTVTFQIQTLAEMSAEDYLTSQRMDFNALTKAANDDDVTREADAGALKSQKEIGGSINRAITPDN